MSRRWWFALLAVVAVGFFVLAAALLIDKLRSAPRALVERAIGKEETTIDIASVVTRIQELSRLETAAMRVVHVSTTTQSYGVVPQMIAGDELTFLAVGDVIAGLDLSAITTDRVVLAPDGTLIMQLPPPEILITRVDNRASRVISRKTGVLRRTDVHLESRARARSEASIRNEALRRGILGLAERNGQTKIADLLRALGVRAVRFEPWTTRDRF